jgi:type I restriction enzyme M protein
MVAILAVPDSMANKYCRSSDLTNEATVESFFVLRLLADLGYEDREILPKRAIQELRIPKGRKREPYRPDYILVARRKPRWLIDAKAVDETIEDWTYQCAGYALLVNRKYKDRPLKFYMLTSGLLTRVYAWDQEEAVLSLRFADFADGNPKFEALKKLLAADIVRRGWSDQETAKDGHLLTRPTMDAVKRAFARCHQIIWKAEKLSPQAAFVEFAKLLFVKLWEDRRLRDNPDHLATIGAGDPLPAEAVRFSTFWIAQQKDVSENPVGDILFRKLVDFLEGEIAQKKRKRIFQPDERLHLSPGTIKRVVDELEDFYLFGIDEDLNGRMFEAFLTATMRGQALGQYFTPRSVVKLMTRLASPYAGPDRIERVIDACCGTGGFLIEALTDMRRMIYENTALTKPERTALLEEIANQAIFGIDAGRDPPITRIARINMYLHGDGGSRIYLTDGLRKVPEPSQADPVELREEVKELRQLLENGERFDVVLTNPPFSMDYSSAVPEENEILQDYELASQGGKKRTSLRSMVMFLERYHQLLKPGGRMFTVVDDGIVSGRKAAFVRSYIRQNFIIRAIISLHGDAFQRAGARAKTTILGVVKRREGETDQPDVFVYESRYIGLDDVVPKTPPSVAEKARDMAVEEMLQIQAAYTDYLAGKKGPWLVPASKLTDRLDAKYLRPWSVTQLEPAWKAAGLDSVALDKLLAPSEDVVQLEPEKRYEFLRISYAGRAQRGEFRLGKEVTYQQVYSAKSNDIVVSHINAVHRALCVLPEGYENLLVSSEFTVLRLLPGVKADPMYLWNVLRTSGVVAEWLSHSSGVGRHRVTWDMLKTQRVPLLTFDQQEKVGDLHREILRLEQQIAQSESAADAFLAPLLLEGEEARDRLIRAKPPR